MLPRTVCFMQRGREQGCGGRCSGLACGQTGDGCFSYLNATINTFSLTTDVSVWSDQFDDLVLKTCPLNLSLAFHRVLGWRKAGAFHHSTCYHVAEVLYLGHMMTSEKGPFTEEGYGIQSEVLEETGR